MNALNKHNEVEIIKDIINQVLKKHFPRGHTSPFFADDTAVGTGYTFKYHRTSEFNIIWDDVLAAAHKLGLTNWKHSQAYDWSDPKKPTDAKWYGIRSARLPKKRRSFSRHGLRMKVTA